MSKSTHRGYQTTKPPTQALVATMNRLLDCRLGDWVSRPRRTHDEKSTHRGYQTTKPPTQALVATMNRLLDCRLGDWVSRPRRTHNEKSTHRGYQTTKPPAYVSVATMNPLSDSSWAFVTQEPTMRKTLSVATKPRPGGHDESIIGLWPSRLGFWTAKNPR